MLYQIIIAPIEAIIEFVFVFCHETLERGVGLSIFGVSLAVNFLALPIYLVADEIQAKERKLQKRMADRVANMKKAFAGDERFLRLNTYYRENGWHPAFALRSTLPILFQVPFFVAAYHFLSNCDALEGVSLAFLKDLGEPDALLHFWKISLNLLPILMTTINCASAAIYTRGFPLREKAQTFALAAIFLVLLYKSPSGLVFYWILNQIFSLCKNIVQKSKNPARATRLAIACLLVAILSFAVAKNPREFGRKKALLAILLIADIFGAKILAAFKARELHETIGFFIENLLKNRVLIVKFLLVVLGVSVFRNPATFGFKKMAILAAGAFFAILPEEKSQFWQNARKIFSAELFALLAFSILQNPRNFGPKKCILLASALAFAFYAKNLQKIDFAKAISLPALDDAKFRAALFAFSAAPSLALAGFYLPSCLISTSPAEFSFIGGVENPLFYVKSAAVFFFGLFVCWPAVLYGLFGAKTKKAFAWIFPIMAICALANAEIFSHNYGILDCLCNFENADAILGEKSFRLTVLPIALFLALIVASPFLLNFDSMRLCKFFPTAFACLALSLALVGVKNCGKIKTGFVAYAERKAKNIDAGGDIEPVFHLSKTGKNVLVIFLDRAISSFVPFIAEQFPDLRQKFSGFTYFPNTLSFGCHTNFAVPAMFGGYEYSPLELDKRDELLGEKHCEALNVAPRLFSEAGFDVTVCDAPWECEYFDDWHSVYANSPYVNNLHIVGMYKNRYFNEKALEVKNLGKSSDLVRDGVTRFSVLQSFFPCLRKFIYKRGESQNFVDGLFSARFPQLYYLSQLTDFQSDKDTYTFFCSEATHDAQFLNNPEFDIPVDEANSDGITFPSPGGRCLGLYHVNAAAILQLAKYFDFLRENDCYDNTRIIIVGDHGDWLGEIPQFALFSDPVLQTCINPLLMFKDFDATGDMQTSDEFMTNADTLFLSKKDLPVSDENPFTHKKLTQQKDGGIEVAVCHNWSMELHNWNPVEQHNWKKFSPGEIMYHVRDNIFDPANWKEIEITGAER